MIYEALSCGAQVGLLPMPRVKNAGRVAKGVEALVQNGLLCRYQEWKKAHKLPQCLAALAEADRCVRSFIKDHA